eukprot:gnl/MRDRNA2_/MRDRNA2_97676_c0_seq1.p1 gnl/MRDRNA2_/MRDRNA2_97676_c0~~gnl/MRDRNA2_/MRDRNA2_97676_c0_seq1.p1  ORF type:complete len:223 (+),score=30.87 gnl/MRDRNA2_/MRDRNA2_97676_c0_seq1:126-794(+)
MRFFQASFSSSSLVCIVIAEVSVIAAGMGGVQLSGKETVGPTVGSLRHSVHSQSYDSGKGTPQMFPKKEGMALTQRMVSMSFVNTDWSNGCVWGLLFGWIGGVLWVAPAVFAASTRSPSHISHDTPVWPVNHAASCMAGWGAFCGTLWLLQWFVSLPYCFLASLVAAGVAFVLGNHVVASGKNLSSAVTWSTIGTCSVVVLLTVIFVLSNRMQTPAAQNHAR